MFDTVILVTGCRGHLHGSDAGAPGLGELHAPFHIHEEVASSVVSSGCYLPF